LQSQLEGFGLKIKTEIILNSIFTNLDPKHTNTDKLLENEANTKRRSTELI
jgi:hypothetical protein